MVFALDGRGGGFAPPPFLQGRVPSPMGQFNTRPMITPKASVTPGEVKPKPFDYKSANAKFQTGHGIVGQVKNKIAAITPKNAMPAAPVSPMTPPPNPQQSLYDYLKGDLEAQRKSAMAGAVTDAANRGVYYGSPLTTSQGDIQTEYLKGLGSLQANVLQNEQQNQLQRFGLAANLLNNMPQQGAGGIDPAVFQMLGQLFGGSGGGAAAPNLPRPGPMKLPIQEPPLRGVTPKPVK